MGVANSTISPLLLLVDETSNVLDLLEMSNKRIVELKTNSTNSSGIPEKVDETEIKTKIESLTQRIGRIQFSSPADKQLAQDLLARVKAARQDVKLTLNVEERLKKEQEKKEEEEEGLEGIDAAPRLEQDGLDHH